MDDTDETEQGIPGPEVVTQDDESATTEYRTLAHGHLSPRHRRFAQLAAEGKSNSDIGRELGYVDSRVSVLLKNPHIAAEVSRLQERIFEETISTRLKSFAEPALNNIHMILTDRTNRVKVSEKAEMSKWVVEKIDGKAASKIEVGDNLLASLMDRLDSIKGAGRSVGPVVNINIGQNPQTHGAIDVTPSGDPQLSAPKSEEDVLAEWAKDFASST